MMDSGDPSRRPEYVHSAAHLVPSGFNADLDQEELTRSLYQRRRTSAAVHLSLKPPNHNDYIHNLYRERMKACLSPTRLQTHRQQTEVLKSKFETMHREYTAEQTKHKQLLRNQIKRAMDEIERQRLEQAQEEEKFLKEQLELRRKRTEEAIEITKQMGEQVVAEAAKARAEAKAKQDAAKKTYLSLKGVEEFENQYRVIESFIHDIDPKVKSTATKGQIAQLKSCKIILQNTDAREVIKMARETLSRLVMGCSPEQSTLLKHKVYYIYASYLVQRVKQNGPQMFKNAEETTGEGAFIPAFLTYFTKENLEFLDYYIGILKRECPYLIPKLPVKAPSAEKIRAFLAKKEDYMVLEKTDPELYHYLGLQDQSNHYLHSQSAMIRIYACICVYQLPIGQTHPYPIGHAWTWLARFLNLQPCPMTLFLLNAFLEIAFDRLLSAYGMQMHKIMILLRDEYIPYVKSKPKQCGKPGQVFNVEEGVGRYFSTGKYLAPPEIVE